MTDRRGSSGYILLEDGTRFDGDLHGDANLPGITVTQYMLRCVRSP